MGDTPLVEITGPMINEVIDAVKVKRQTPKGHPIRGICAARDARRQLSAFFNWCIDRGHLATNPIGGMRRSDLGQKRSPGNVASDDHIKYFWLAAEQAGAQGRAWGPAPS